MLEDCFSPSTKLLQIDKAITASTKMIMYMKYKL